jgi:hypothetical protein
VCLIAFDLNFVSGASSRDGKTQPVLIPHTRLRARLAANPQTTTIHPSIVKEQIGPLEGRKDKAM